MYDVIIIGAGPSGLTALLYAKHYNLNALCIGDAIGGKLIKAPGIIDYPGYEKIEGKEFIDHLMSQLKTLDANVVEKKVTYVGKSLDKNIFSVKTEDGASYEAQSLIISAGNGTKQVENRVLELSKLLGVTMNNNLVHVDSFGRTNIDGVFASGDCIAFPTSLEQLTTAVSTGITAAAGVYFFLKNEKPPILWGNAKIPRR
jgi:thioredoxin reductase